MPEIINPLTFDDLPVKPPLVGRPLISEDLQQTVALLVGWDKATRRLVSVSPSGVLHIAQSPVKGIINALAASNGFTGQGDNISTSEVLIKAKPTNTGTIWINISAAAANNVGYPLDAGEYVVFSVNNLHSVNYYFTTKDDWGIVVYTK
ncbi:unnamed protein product [marine sediment metagenome]|uniref:Uncharacterized protein n=1 Tax=marine sediment metagenome TaxID=412755 RepID=X1R4F0_9ZZZZ